MSARYAKHYSTRQTPQSEPIPGTAQVPNSAGGYAFAVDDWTRLERFLILGSEGGLVLRDRAGADGREREGGRGAAWRPTPTRAIRTIVEVSDSGRAPKNEPAVLALAIAAGMGHAAAACEALPKVCRTGTHLFAFAEAVQGLRGLGPRAQAGRRRLVRGPRGPTPWPTRSPSTSGATAGRTATCSGWRTRPRPTPPSRRSTAGSSAGPRRSGPREVKRGEAVASYPDVAAAPARACSPRWTSREDGRPRRPSHPADPRGRPAARVHPDGAPERARRSGRPCSRACR